MSRINIEEIYSNLIQQFKEDINKINEDIKVCIIQVGDNPNSNIYVSNKIKAFKEVGIKYDLFKYNEYITEEKLEQILDTVSNDDEYSGMFVQLPLPKQLDFNKLKLHINPTKDIDGFCDANTINLYDNKYCLVPATPQACDMLLNYSGISLDGKTVTVINRSNIIGKPLVHLLANKNATVIWCNSHTNEETLKNFCKSSDIIISGVNKANIFDKSYFNDNSESNQIIIDLTTEYQDGKLYGSINREHYEDIMKYNKLTTVGMKKFGMGKLTICSLIHNVIKSYKMQNKNI